MPKISELPSVLTLDINDVAAFVSKDNQNVDQTMKVKVSEVATKIVNNIEYGSLNTSDKKVLGAINEVNGKAKDTLSDLTDTTITTPSNADLLAYDSSTSKWVNTDLKGQASGSIATFSNGGNGIPCSVECEINPTQSGSGTPSPSNPRPISGVSNLDISVADGDMVVQHTYTLALGETVYGGVARNGGTGYLTHICLNFSDLDFSASNPGNHVFRGDYNGTYYGNIKFPPDGNTPTTAITEHYESMAYGPISASDNGRFAIADYNTLARFVFIDFNYSTQADFETARNNDKIIVPLVNPIPITFTGEKIPTLSGNNNIYHNGNGDVSVDYFTDKADNIAELIKAFL